jgi:pimeloyl-ACP methyl ester carboxylesterase
MIESTPDTSAATNPEPSDDFDPSTRTIDWTECDDGECAEVAVPIDYDDPSAGTTTVALLRIPPGGEPDDRVGTMFINPGGPGESGIEFAQFATQVFSPTILDAFDIVGFDPRGVGQSDPLECLDDAGLDEYVAADVDPDDPASVEAYGELVIGMGEACLSTNPELSQHVTTGETAMDLDVLRALVGDDELYYYGASYGTMLGATYAALFPDRVGRLELDVRHLDRQPRRLAAPARRRRRIPRRTNGDRNRTGRASCRRRAVGRSARRLGDDRREDVSRAPVTATRQAGQETADPGYVQWAVQKCTGVHI